LKGAEAPFLFVKVFYEDCELVAWGDCGGPSSVFSIYQMVDEGAKDA
jgi:hypothetical protein